MSGLAVFFPSLTKEFNTISAPLMEAQINPGVRLVLIRMEIIKPTSGDIVDQTVHFFNRQQIQRILLQLLQLLQLTINYLQNPPL